MVSDRWFVGNAKFVSCCHKFPRGMPKLKAEKKSRQHTAVAKQGIVQLV